MQTIFPRLAVILLVMVAWVFASNHCALGAVSASGDDHACCHGGDPSPAPETMIACCQSLGAPIPSVAAAPVTPLYCLFPAWTEQEILPPPAWEGPGQFAIFPPSPPGAVPFAELVLNRSLLAHAPPVVVA